MKKIIIPFSLILFSFALLLSSCASDGANGEGTENVQQQIPLSEYIGTYDILETKDSRQCRVFLQNDSLYLQSDDVGESKMIAEKNEVFDVPGHETRMRFLRDSDGGIDRVVILTKRGRFTGKRANVQ